MNTADLRIGNIIIIQKDNTNNLLDQNSENVLGVFKMVKGVSLDSIIIEDKGDYNIIDSNKWGGFRITSEFLISIGAKKELRGRKIYYSFGDFFELEQFNDLGDFSYTIGDPTNGNYTSLRIDFLHQLQNYFYYSQGCELMDKYPINNLIDKEYII